MEIMSSEGETISDKDPEAVISVKTIEVVKWAVKVEWLGDEIDSALYGILYKEENGSIVLWSGTYSDVNMNCFTWSKKDNGCIVPGYLCNK